VIEGGNLLLGEGSFGKAKGKGAQIIGGPLAHQNAEFIVQWDPGIEFFVGQPFGGKGIGNLVEAFGGESLTQGVEDGKGITPRSERVHLAADGEVKVADSKVNAALFQSVGGFVLFQLQLGKEPGGEKKGHRAESKLVLTQDRK